MFDTRALRASALGFGLSFLLSPPVADGTLGSEDGPQALMAYPVSLSIGLPLNVIEATVGYTDVARRVTVTEIVRTITWDG